MPKEVKTPIAKKAAAPKKATGLSVPMYALNGKESGVLDLPKEVFGKEPNQQLLAQAVRVYMNNQTGHHSHTKTRGEVKGSTRKLGSQKGSGHARHGSIKAPIFVGGGIALGPRARVVRLELPKRMKRAALEVALSVKTAAGNVMGVAGLDDATGKTKQIASLVKMVNRKNVLLVTDEKKDSVVRAVHNLENASVKPVSDLNALDVVSHTAVLFTKEAVAKLGGTK